MKMNQPTSKIIRNSVQQVSQYQKAQKEYQKTLGLTNKVNLTNLKAKLEKIVDGYTKAYSKILNQSDITEQGSIQRKKQFIRQYLKLHLKNEIETVCKRRDNSIDKDFANDIYHILNENFAKPVIQNCNLPEKSFIQKTKQGLRGLKQYGEKILSYRDNKEKDELREKINQLQSQKNQLENRLINQNKNLRNKQVKLKEDAEFYEFLSNGLKKKNEDIRRAALKVAELNKKKQAEKKQLETQIKNLRKKESELLTALTENDTLKNDVQINTTTIIPKKKGFFG